MLNDPKDTYFFRNDYGSEALHTARKNVEKLYPNRPIETQVHGDYRAKDTFSLRCVDIESELEKGTPDNEVLPIVKQWAPVKRTDLYADNVTSGTIEYNRYDPGCLNSLIEGDKKNSLSFRAAKKALQELTKNGPPQAGRVPLSEAMRAALGPLEQVNIFRPLPENKKQKEPRVVYASNILHYGSPQEQKQFVQNLQETCAEGSRFVIGPNESRIENLPDLLKRHGFTPDRKANSTLKKQRADNPIIFEQCKEMLRKKWVYLKKGR